MVKKTVVFSKDAYLTLLKYVQEECEKCESRLDPKFVDYDELGKPLYNWQVEQHAEAESFFPVWKKIYECLLGVDED